MNLNAQKSDFLLNAEQTFQKFPVTFESIEGPYYLVNQSGAFLTDQNGNRLIASKVFRSVTYGTFLLDAQKSDFLLNAE